LNLSISRHSFHDFNKGLSIYTKADIFQRTIFDHRGVNSIKTGKVFSIVGAVILAAVLLAGCLGGGGGGGGTWIPKAGDFMEYTASGGEGVSTMRMTVKNFTDTTITMNVSLTYGGSGPYYSESTVPRSQSTFLGFDVNHPPSGYNVVKVGTETLSTNWGSRSADHYRITVSGSPGTIDMWIRSGIAMKFQLTSTSATTAWTLTDTNISLITSA
jgi:hypothetical protein